MSYKNRRILTILIEECNNAPERYPTYRDTIKEIVANIVAMEKDHNIAHTNIVQNVRAQIEVMGKELLTEMKSGGDSND